MSLPAVQKEGSNLPQFSDIGVIALVPNHWRSHSSSTRHHVISRLTRYFHVAWVNPMTPCVAADGCCNRGISCRALTIPEHDDLVVCSLPWWIERCVGPQMARELRVRQARRALRKRGCSRIVVYVWSYDLDVSARIAPWDLKCYHIDDEYTWSETDKPIPAAERELLATVDQVFVHSEAMMLKKGQVNPHTLLVPNGVDYPAYARPCEEPADLASIPRPRIGCVGWVKNQLDLQLMSELAGRHPQWSFVFVGPQKPAKHFGEQQVSLERLKRTSNVHFLGNKPVCELPSYTQHLDVGVLCYRVNDYTKYICPLKLHEYLAAGIPAVSADLPAVRPFQDVVKIARTTEEWSGLLEDAVAPEAKAVAQQQARQAVARQYDWNLLVARVANAICTRLKVADVGQEESTTDSAETKSRHQITNITA